jgi:hypothetical protein
VKNRDPAWTPDGKRIAYSGYRDGVILWKAVDSSGPEEVLVRSENITAAGAAPAEDGAQRAVNQKSAAQPRD